VCHGGTVVVQETTWTTRLGTGRSVWLDEPTRCTRGCLLSPVQVQKLVLDLYRRPVRQLPLELSELEAAG
jgi:hypothetical protein